VLLALLRVLSLSGCSVGNGRYAGFKQYFFAIEAARVPLPIRRNAGKVGAVENRVPQGLLNSTVGELA
jgi:hypothetical protein